MEALFPLAVFATSLGRGAGGMVPPEFVAAVMSPVSRLRSITTEASLPLSPLILTAGRFGVPAFARKFFVTDTALKVVGFLTELERT